MLKVIRLLSICLFYSILLIAVTSKVEAQKGEKVEKCECPAKSSLANEIKSNSVIFLGQVIEVRPQYPLHNNFYYVRFLPMKKYKGLENYPNSESVVVYAPVSTDPCTLKFIKGNDYLVFADGNPAFLKTNSCSMSGLQEGRSQEILELNKLKEGK